MRLESRQFIKNQTIYFTNQTLYIKMVLTDVEDPNGPYYIDKRFSRNDSKNRRQYRSFWSWNQWRIDTKNDDKISGSVGGEENTRIKLMITIGYRGVNEFENPSEELKEVIRIITNNPERTAENIEAVKTIITELRTLQKENDDINEKNKK